MSAVAPDDVFAQSDDLAWLIEDSGSDPLREGSRESRFTVSNGFLGVPCSFAVNREGGLVLRPGRTYIAGLFDSGAPGGLISALVPAPDWLQLRLSPDSVMPPCEMTAHRRVLDLRRGMVLLECRTVSGSAIAFRVRALHAVSLAERAIGVQLVEVTFETGDVDLTLEAQVDTRDFGLVCERLEQKSARWSTKRSGKRLGMAVSCALAVDGTAVPAIPRDDLGWSWRVKARGGQSMLFQRTVAFARDDERAPHEPDVDVRVQRELAIANDAGRRSILADHETAWQRRWFDSDIVVEGDTVAQRALRFAVYALNSAADPTDERVSIGARALTGDDYHGHVFWDTEIYLVPFYVFTWPAAARSLLMYRYHTLAGARAKAALMGWRGALYAWESADTGAETAPENVVGPDRGLVAVVSGRQEQHISADVAYAVWQYWQATNDEAFLLDAGAEILLETARFWASRAVLEADGRRHIRGVMGPDEYHENVDDSAFTNVMARWNIRRALDTVVLLRARWPARWSELSKRLALDEGELALWQTVTQTIVTGLDPKTGIYEEFAGYFDLEDIDLAAYAGRSVPMDVILGHDRTQRSQVVKQADIVALVALLPDEFAGASVAANFAYYEPRCGQGSSLSGALHALVAARLGREETALRYFSDTAAIDLRETHAAISGGVHIAAQGGLWLAVVFGFCGFALRNDGVSFDPHVPRCWQRMSFRMHWQGRRLHVAIDTALEICDVTLEDGAAMAVFVRGSRYELDACGTLRVSLATVPSVSGSIAENEDGLPGSSAL